MPLYGAAQSGSSATLSFDGAGNPIYTPKPGLNLTSLGPGEFMKLFDAEVVAAGQASIAISRGNSPSAADNGITFQIIWASAPTAVIEIQGSNVDVDADYETLYSSSNVRYDNYTDTVRWQYYRAKVISYSAGGACTVNAQR